MIEDLKPYPEYKDSGLSWLGEVPVHWPVQRIKTVLQETDRRSQEGTETLLSLTRIRGLIPHREMTEKMYGAKTLVGYKKYRAGQLVMNRMQAWSGMFGAGRVDGLVSPDYAVFNVLGKHSVQFILERIKSPDLVGQFALESKGIGSGFNRLYTDRFGQIAISLPPPSEQAEIARFLAWATNRLDRAIGAKRRIIALLQEQKQAIIHRAVTRGLDPSLPLKDSGIPWLGEIPEHWEVRRLGHAVCLQTGYPFTSTGFIQAQSGTRLLRGVNVTPSQIRWDEVVRWQRHVGDGLDDYTLQVGDVVLGMDRPIIGAGVRTALIRKDDTPSLLLQRVARLRSTEILHTEFMLLLLRGRTFHEYMAPIFTGISVPHLSPQQIKNFRVALPPIEEQRNIVAELMEQTYELDSAIASNEQEIALLREYRTRLIADVVTGKLDVREAAAGLPEPHNANDEQLEPEEEEPEFVAEDAQNVSMD
jgi:type I restriction enzyme S subunit